MTIDILGHDFDFLDRTEDVEQGSGAWLQARIGQVTGSHIAEVLHFTKDKRSCADRETYKYEVVCERLTSTATDHFVTDAMLHGTDTEPAARTQYEVRTGEMVAPVGFIPHPCIPRSGGSPDGTIGSDGLIEIKCPNTKTHVEWLIAGEVPPEHEPQMMFYLACTGRAWCDFTSYDPRLPEHLQLFIKRLDRDDARIAEIESAVVQFSAEVDAIINQLNALKEQA